MSQRPSELPVVLAVDDDDAARDRICRALEQLDFQVFEATSGSEALEKVETVNPGVILIAVNLAGPSGIETAERIRQHPASSHIPIVMMTGEQDTEDIASAFQAGATDFEQKSVAPRVLAERLRFIWRASTALRDLKKSEARLEAAQEMARIGHWEWDAVTGRHTWSTETRRLLGYDANEEATHKAFLAAIHPADRSRIADALSSALRWTDPVAFDYRIISPRGVELFVHTRCQAIHDRRGFAIGAGGTLQDITDRKRWEEQIRFLAYYDPMTGLPNRALFRERLAPVLADARRRRTQSALIFMDIDNFKRVNDTLGHSAGDDLIKEVGNRIASAVRDTDTVSRVAPDDYSPMLARLGGDEFVVLLSNIRTAEDAARAATRMLGSLRTPIQLAGREVFVTSSIGISIFPNDGDDLETLIKNADAAMYAAKDSGRNGYQFFDPKLNHRAFQRLALETALRRALERAELELHYQPIVDISSATTVKLEGLLRWRHPEMGLVPPDDFIPVAEDSGLIEPIAEWTIREACRQQRQWAEVGYLPTIAINISPRNLYLSGVARRLVDVVMEVGGEPSRIAIELTEGFLRNDLPDVRQVIRAWKEFGFSICLDDFGRGYSSLGYLRELPVDILKVDRSFVRDLETDPTARALTAAIAAMAKVLGMEPVAEGVEQASQRDILRSQGYRLMQGYLFGAPAPPNEVRKLVGQVPQVAGSA